MADLCQFCNLGDGNNEELGPLCHNGTITVHQNCLYFSSGLCQNADTSFGLFGFLEEDIKKEIARGLAHSKKCSGCGQKGLFVGCAVTKCSKAGHLPCLLKQGFLLQFYDNFKVFCSTHRPKQQTHSSLLSTTSHVCTICLCDITLPSSSNKSRSAEIPFDILQTPCCHNLCHRKCIQAQASSAGIHYFRCPVCNNFNKFKKKMLLLGIEIPTRDASWETSDQFSDLHNPEVYCNQPICTSIYGRKIREMDKFISCDWCGQCIGHNNCVNGCIGNTNTVVMITGDASSMEYICCDCIPVYKKMKLKKFQIHSSPHFLKKRDEENIPIDITNTIPMNTTPINPATPTKAVIPTTPIKTVTSVITRNTTSIMKTTSINDVTPTKNTTPIKTAVIPTTPTKTVNFIIPTGNTTPIMNTTSINDVTPTLNTKAVTPIVNTRNITPINTKPTISPFSVNEDTSKKCTASQCGCIYGRHHNSPRGSYSIIFCSKCYKNVGHLECFKVSNRNSLTSKQVPLQNLCDSCNHLFKRKWPVKHKWAFVDSDDEDAPDTIVISNDDDDDVISISSDEESSQRRSAVKLPYKHYGNDNNEDFLKPSQSKVCKRKNKSSIKNNFISV